MVVLSFSWTERERHWLDPSDLAAQTFWRGVCCDRKGKELIVTLMSTEPELLYIMCVICAESHYLKRSYIFSLNWMFWLISKQRYFYPCFLVKIQSESSNMDLYNTLYLGCIAPDAATTCLFTSFWVLSKWGRVGATLPRFL